MRLDNLHIKNFRSIKDSGEIENISKIFALIGRNNTGKSSFLKGVQALFTLIDIEKEDFHKDTTDSIEISGTLSKYVDDKLVKIEAKITCSPKNFETQYYIGGKEQSSKATYKKALPELLCINDIRIPTESRAEGAKLTLLNKILKLSVAADPEISKRYSELNTELEGLKEKEAQQASEIITAKFQSVLNEQNYSVSISPTADVEKSMSYHTGIQDTNVPDGKTVDILNSGTGLQSMYILALLEVWAELSKKNDDAILLIEEPEVYLHPEYQRRMFAALRRIGSNNQVIFTTHSPIMIADIWLTESVRQVRLNKQGETIIEKVKIEDVINELGIRYEDVLNPKLVVFVEGVDDEKFYTKLLELPNGSIKIIPADKFRAIQHFAFIKIMSSENVKNSFVIIADSDGTVPDDRKIYLKNQVIAQFNVVPLGLAEKLEERIIVLNRYEIESYFLTPEILGKCFTSLSAEDVKTFLAEYVDKYVEKQTEIKAEQFSLDNFQRYLKPKKIFELEGHENGEVAYREFWREQTTFLRVRDEICRLCTEMSKTGTDWFGHIVNNMELNDPELLEKKAAILSFLI